MTVIKLALLKHTRAKDGSYKIRIAIGHRSETHYIVTPYSVNSPSEFKDGSVVRLANASQMNLELTQLLLDYQQRLKRISYPERYTCGELRKILQSMKPFTSDATLSSVASEYISELQKDGQVRYAEMLDSSINFFMDFIGGDVFLSTITPQNIMDYDRFLRRRTFLYNGEQKHLSDTTINIRMSNLRTIINRAIKMQIVRYDIHPFLMWHKRTDPERELDIPVEDIRRIRDYIPKGYRESAYRDLFMLSYILGGINLIDLLAFDFRNKTTLEYVRHKSRNTKHGDKRISLTIQPEAFPYIRRHMDQKTGRLTFNINLSYDLFQKDLNRTLKRIGRKIGLKMADRMCWYVARKSFVQHGFDLGITLEVLEYCIGQSVKTNRPIFNYLKIMRRHADDAVRRILDNLAMDTSTINDSEIPSGT